MNQSRRHFLRASAAMAAFAGGPLAGRVSAPFATSLAGLASLAAQSSLAADLSGPYKAIVCLFLSGGNDSHNWIVPTHPDEYAQYASARQSLAWPIDKLVGITTTTSQGSGRSFAMPTDLDPLRQWYDAGHAAVVANVGTLVRPTTLADYNAGKPLPPKLFSHNDQTSVWQSMAPEGASTGWGGRMGDILMSANGYPVFTAMSASANAVFLSGNSVAQFTVSEDGPIAVQDLNAATLYGSSTAPAALRRIITAAGATPFESEYAKVMKRSIDTCAPLQAALATVAVPDLPTAPIALSDGSSIKLSSSSTAKQLRTVAQLIAAAPALGMQRQIFLVTVPGFDTHRTQMGCQPTLMGTVANSIDFFLSTLKGMGLLNNVTLFTASDFGRTLTSNGDGSDHGWGSHHFVAGGAVKGRDIIGSFPHAALGTSTDIGSGRLLPAVSVDQYAATLGSWLGLSRTDLADLFPHLSGFSPTNLSFL